MKKRRPQNDPLEIEYDDDAKRGKEQEDTYWGNNRGDDY